MLKINPSKEEVSRLNLVVKKFLKKFKIKGVKVMVGGSFAKNTWLSGYKDVDIFVKFKDAENISDKLEKELRKNFKKVKRVHGSRDYFHVKFEDILFEVVPVKDINNINDAENITDCSPLHVDFVKKNTSKKLQNNIRKLKLLLKANKLYGAESYISGFSGYVCELLIINYNGFNNLIKNVRKWKEIEFIDIKKYYKNKNEGISCINYSKRGSLIIIDPVDENRNASAAISNSMFNKFVKLCNEYDGSEGFFVSKKVDISKLKGFIVFEVKPLKGKKDVVGSKLLKCINEIKKIFKMNFYDVVDYGWSWDKKVYFWFKLEKIEKHFGPLIKMKKHSEAFKKKWKKVKKEKNRYYVGVDHKDIDKIIKDVVKDKRVLGKVMKITIKKAL